MSGPQDHLVSTLPAPPGGAAKPAIDSRPPISRRLGKYELLARLGRGGMGEVHRARQDVAERDVALKCLCSPAFATPEDRRRFHDEIRAVARIDHPNIVPIYDVGEHDGEVYFTMKLMTGGTLRDRMNRYRDPARAARLVSVLARAVHAAHEAGIVHRDLKPENILFDDRDEPHLADFGVAKHVGTTGRTLKDLVIGTAGYMSPEQARGDSRLVTRASDVWSLGVILYELIAGQLPFRAATAGELLSLTKSAKPVPLGEVQRGAGVDLDAITMACLEKEEVWRYQTAAALADDLDRSLRGEHALIRRPGRVERALRALARHPVFAAAGVALIAFAIVVTSVAFGQARARRAEVLETNTYAAQHVAEVMLLQIREDAKAVADAAGAPGVAERLAARDRPGLVAACAALLTRRSGEKPSFDSCFVLDLEGRPLAHLLDVPADYYEKSFAFRDYMQGALALPGSARIKAYVSRAIKSGGDGHYKFAIASPVRGAGGAAAGVLVATIATDRQLGRRDLKNDARRTAVIVTRLDRAGPDEPLPTERVALAGERVKHGEKVTIESPAFARLAALRANSGPREQLDDAPASWVETDSDYHDPVSMRPADGYSGAWLTGVAPIGHTDLVALVKTRADDAVALDLRSLLAFIGWFAGGFGLLGGSMFVARRREQSRRLAVPAGAKGG